METFILVCEIYCKSQERVVDLSQPHYGVTLLVVQQFSDTSTSPGHGFGAALMNIGHQKVRLSQVQRDTDEIFISQLLG